MKNFLIFAAAALYCIVLSGTDAQDWQHELKTAKEQGIIFSDDNRTLLKCPPDVVSVKIPSCVTVIGHKAFARCVNLTGVQIPVSVRRIDAGAFTWCTALNKIEIPGSVTIIGKQAFSRCKALTEFKIPAGVTEIGDGVFSGCDKLKSVTVAAGTDENGKVPPFIVDGSGALIDCRKQKLLYLPSGFQGVYTVPEEVVSIGAVAFYCCRKLTRVIFPTSIKNIGGKAFYGCSSLAEISIPAGVTAIGDLTFAKCVSLSKAEIPDSVVNIGKMAFYSCSKLTEVTVSNTCRFEKNSFSCKVIRRQVEK